MSSKQSKSTGNLDYFYARLDSVQMSRYERLRAKARLAQAEAIADAVVATIDLAKRLFKALAPRPVARPTKLAG